MTEMIDLDNATRTREYGTLGLAQSLKQLRDAGHRFPVYGDMGLPEGSFSDLGKLAFHKNGGISKRT